jgi:protein SCO1/2
MNGFVRSVIVKYRLAGALAVLALLVAGCSSSGSGGHAGRSPHDLAGQQQVGPYHGVGLVPPQPRPSFTLADPSGKPFAFGTQTAGHPTLLFFGYTHCPDECPATMADVRLALEDVPASVAEKTYVIFVTTDVKRDTGPVIKQWLDNFSKGSKATWVGLRGTQTEIDAAQAAAHVMLAEDGGETHSTQVLLYGPDDYAHVAFLQSTDEQHQIAHDLPIVAETGS